MDLEELEAEMLENRAEIKELQLEVNSLGKEIADTNRGFTEDPHVILRRLLKRVNKMEQK